MRAKARRGPCAKATEDLYFVVCRGRGVLNLDIEFFLVKIKGKGLAKVS